MNLSGDELMKFARELVADMKAQRVKKRRLEAERRETESRLETEKREAGARLETEKAKLEAEKARLAHDQQMELERLKLQQIQCGNETRIRLDEITAAR